MKTVEAERQDYPHASTPADDFGWIVVSDKPRFDDGLMAGPYNNPDYPLQLIFTHSAPDSHVESCLIVKP